jgi:predicted TIM-barrel fold metal-dependent hydrolase
LGRILDSLPNVLVELGAVIYDPGRQPRHAAAFFERYQDRILMGKDVWEPSEYWTYFRVLETADEYFPYYRKRHAFWRLYGLDLPDGVLRKVYYENALRVIPGISRARFAP